MAIQYRIACLALPLLFLSQPVWAEMEVLESTLPEIAVGATLQDDARLTLPKGGLLRLLVKAPDGTTITKTMKGPYEGTATTYREKRSWWQRLTGRTKDPEAPIGASKAYTKPVK